MKEYIEWREAVTTKENELITEVVEDCIGRKLSNNDFRRVTRVSNIFENDSYRLMFDAICLGSISYEYSDSEITINYTP